MTGDLPTHADRQDVPADKDRSWFEALKTAYREADADNAGIVAAGVAYYAFLAIVPLLGAMVMGYGLFADPAEVAAHARALAGALPQAAAELITGQLESAAQAATGTKGFGLVIALAIALFGARSGALALVNALDIAYDLRDERSFVKQNLLALGMAAGAAVALAVMASVVAATAMLEGMAGRLASYALMFAATVGAALVLYRYAPNRAPPAWRHQLPGAVLFAAAIVVLTVGFGLYVANFGSYNATYGSLGAVVILLTWLYLASYALLIGAELNAPSEHTETRRN